MAIILRMVDGVAGTLTAQQERQAWGAVHGGGSGRQLGGRSGFRVGTPSTVLTATGTTWTLGPCSAMLDPGAQTHQGMYGWSTDANVTGTVTAADANNPRKDIVYIQLNDSDMDTSGAKSAPVLYLAGNAGTNPQPPALPPRSFLVGTISVPVATGGSPTVALNPARYVAAGGLLPVNGAADRATITAPYVGQEIQRTDLTQLSSSGIKERWNGTNWDHFGHAEFTTSNTAGASIWGMGVFSRDTAPTTDDAFVSIAATDILRPRDAGLYSITVMVSFAVPIEGLAWLSVDGSYTVPMTAGLQNFVATLPNVRLAAGADIKPQLSRGSGADKAFTSRVRVTRIA